MSLTKQDVKDRKKYERTRDCRWHQIEESKLQKKLTDLAIEHNTKLRTLTVEQGKFKTALEKKGIRNSGSQSLSSLSQNQMMMGRRSSIEISSWKQQTPPTSDSNDSRIGSQEAPRGNRKMSIQEITIFIPSSADGQTHSAPSNQGSRPDTPLDNGVIIGGNIVTAPSSLSSSISTSNSGGDLATSTSSPSSSQHPAQPARERSNTFGGQTGSRYKPNLPEVQE